MVGMRAYQLRQFMGRGTVRAAETVSRLVTNDVEYEPKRIHILGR